MLIYVPRYDDAVAADMAAIRYIAADATCRRLPLSEWRTSMNTFCRAPSFCFTP